MPTHRMPILFAMALLVGCTQAVQPLPPAPQGLRRITVQQPANSTGAELVIDQAGLLGRLIDEKRKSVPDQLADDLRDQLARRGFKVADGPTGWPTEPVLRTEIRRWETYTADYSLVTVDVAAAVVDPEGRELWKAERRGWRIPTRDAGSLRDASMAASASIAEALVDGWKAVPAPPKTP